MIAIRCPEVIVVAIIRMAVASAEKILESAVVVEKGARTSGHLHGMNHMAMMVRRVRHLDSTSLER